MNLSTLKQGLTFTYQIRVNLNAQYFKTIIKKAIVIALRDSLLLKILWFMFGDIK